MKHFVKVRIWDLLLCILCQVGLIFTIFAGFILDDAVCNNVLLVILILAVLDVIFFAFSYNRISMFVGIGLGILAIAFYIYRAAATGIFADEAAHSLGISLFLIFVTALAVYLLGRSLPGIVVLFLLGNFIIAGAHFLQYEVQLWTFLVFEIAVCLFFLYRNYCKTIMQVHAGQVKIPTFIVQSVILCLIAFVLGCGVYKAVIKPLQPPTRDLKLITVLEDMDMLKVFGVSSVREMLDPDKLNSDEIQQILYSNQLNESGETEYDAEPETEEATQAPAEDPVSAGLNNVMKRTGELLAQFVYNIFHNYGWIWIVCVVAAAVAAVFAVRNGRRKKWRGSVDALSRENQVVNYYQYFLSRLGKLGYKKPPQHTLYEYAESVSHEMEAFICEDITFEKLTRVYVDTYYGGHSVSEEQASWFRKFYEAFSKNTRKELGFFKYCLKYFAL